MKLIVVRHGETNYNVQRILNFTPTKDCYLTEKGTAQAYQVKQELATKNWDVVLISELYRTEQTATIINEDKQKVMFIEPLLNEINTGLEGESYDAYKYLLSEYGKPEGAESFADVEARVRTFLSQLRKKEFSSVLIVTHFAVLRALKKVIENLSFEDIAAFQPKNCEVYECEI